METAATETQRSRIAGLRVGKIVNFVMRGGVIRPLIVSDARDLTGLIDGVVFFNLKLDQQLFLTPLQVRDSGHKPDAAAVVVSIPFGVGDENGVFPEWSWHFAGVDEVMAAGVDAHAIEVQVMAILDGLLSTHFDNQRDEITTLVNAKLTTNLAAVAQLLESHESLVSSLVERLEKVREVAEDYLADDIREGDIVQLASGSPDLKVHAVDGDMISVSGEQVATFTENKACFIKVPPQVKVAPFAGPPCLHDPASTKVKRPCPACLTQGLKPNPAGYDNPEAGNTAQDEAQANTATTVNTPPATPATESAEAGSKADSAKTTDSASTAS